MEEVFREKDKGVSAIVGTILIVAITVVLAATVYGVLTGFGGLISGGAPSGAIQVSSTGTNYTISFTQLSKNVSLSNVEIKYTTTAGTTAVVGNPLVDKSGTPAVSVSTSGNLSISTVLTIDAGAALSSISIVDTSPSGTIATWSS